MTRRFPAARASGIFSQLALAAAVSDSGDEQLLYNRWACLLFKTLTCKSLRSLLPPASD